MKFSFFTDKGKVRSNNEDSYFIVEQKYPIIGVADGMGGHQAGEVASRIAVEKIKNFNFAYEGKLLSSIEQAIDEVNSQIIKTASSDSSLNGMGTTLSFGIIYKYKLYLGHVGDSRIYLFRKQELNLLTTDHSLVNELLVQNKISSEEAFNHPQKHILTQALGVEENIKIEVKEVSLEPGDLLLFCTDGLSDMIRTEEMENIIKNNCCNPDKLSKALGTTALNNGGNDNITLVLSIIN